MSKEVLILFGTQSGNSEDLASQLAKSAESHNLTAKVQDMEETSLEQMAQSERILIICSTSVSYTHLTLPTKRIV